MSIADDAAEPLSRGAFTDAGLLARGVCRALAERGYATLLEFSLASGRRADVLALGRGGEIAIIEIKSSLADFRADRKWRQYREFCDRLYFAVAADFPRELIPAECGLIIADSFGAAVLREAEPRRLDAARRKAVTLRFARAAAQRLRRLTDPGGGEGELL
ncbi:MAG TPA: MmcB family DNA repair protein [Stellaceae bacterium]|nr:MmcB family DNA repair protein [Stellaceae bacterium]